MLYEVITTIRARDRRHIRGIKRGEGRLDQCRRQVGTVGADDGHRSVAGGKQRRSHPLQPCAEIATPRITSYNVCYTKLLRGSEPASGTPRIRARPGCGCAAGMAWATSVSTPASLTPHRLDINSLALRFLFDRNQLHGKGQVATSQRNNFV